METKEAFNVLWGVPAPSNAVAFNPLGGKEYFLQHVSQCWNKNKKQGAWVLWISVIWSIWNHRNDCIFRNESVQVENVLEQLQFKSWLWMRGRIKGFGCSLYE